MATAFMLVALTGVVSVANSDEAEASILNFEGANAGFLQRGYFETGQVWAERVYDPFGDDYLVKLTVGGPTVWPSGNGYPELISVYTTLYQWTTQGWLQVQWTNVSQSVIYDGRATQHGYATFSGVPSGWYWIQQYVLWTSQAGNAVAGVSFGEARDMQCNTDSVYPHCVGQGQWFYVYSPHPYL